MSKQRRRRIKRSQQVRSHRNSIRNGIEQLENRVLPGGFLDLLAGAAIASNFDLLPEEQLVPEEIESESVGSLLQTTIVSSSLESELALPATDDRAANDDSSESSQPDDDFDIAIDSRATTAPLLATSLIDSFFAGHQFTAPSPSLPISQSPPLSTPPRSFSSPISQLGAGVGTGSGQGYNVTGAELPQSNVGNSFASTSSMPAWMMGEGEDPPSGSSIPSGSSTASATSSASSPPPPPPAEPPSTNMGDPCSGSASGSASGMTSASGNVSVSGGASVEEQSGDTAKFWVSFSGYAPCGFAVDFSTSDGSATAGDDYSETSGSVWFEGTDGELVIIEVGIANDDIVEGNEDFILTLDGVHDGSGGAVDGDIEIGYGSGAGSGSGSGSSDGVSANATIRNDDYDVTWSVSGTAEEGGASAKLTVTVTPNPLWHSIPLRAITLGAPGDSNADGALDIANNPIDFNGTSGGSTLPTDPSHTLEILISAADDAEIEDIESFVVNLVSNGTGTPPEADAIHIQPSTANTFDVVDNEWRWVGEDESVISELISGTYNDGNWVNLFTDRFDGFATAATTGSTGLQGPNTIEVAASITATYIAGVVIPSAASSTATANNSKSYSCDPQSGQISPNTGQGGNSSGGGITDAAAVIGGQTIENGGATENFVTVDVGVGGGVYGAYSVTGVTPLLEFGLTEDFGKDQSFEGTITLRCRKGTS